MHHLKSSHNFLPSHLISCRHRMPKWDTSFLRELLLRNTKISWIRSELHAPIPITMASRGFTKALRAASRQKLPSQSFQRRTLTYSLAARPAIAASTRATFAGPIQQQVRGVKTIDFAGHKEQVFGEFISIEYLEYMLTRIRTRGLAT
jgi:hypothetical protein